MAHMDEFNNGQAPGISADRLNEPFHLKSLTYDAGNDRVELLIGRGRETFGETTMVSKTVDSTTYINAPAINTTYYLYLQSAGTWLTNTTGVAVTGAVLIWSIQVGATKSTLTKVDRRPLLGKGDAHQVAGDLANHQNTTAAGIHGSTSAATPNTVMHRDAAGRAKVAAPAAGDDVARKDTVDAVQTNLTNHQNANPAHAAANISYAGSTNLSATNVEAALDELDTEKAGLALANSFSQRQTFQAGIQDGDANTDTSLLYALGLPVDTRSFVATAWNANNKPTTIEIRNGATPVATVTVTYNSDDRPTSIQVVGGGKTITYTITWTSDRFDSYTKAVV